MSASTPAEAAIDLLLRRGKLTSGKIVVGPLGTNATRLLSVLWTFRTDLELKKGNEQVILLRQAYLETTAPCVADNPETNEVTIPLAEESGGEGFIPLAKNGEPRKPGWRLHHLRCKSLRGIALIGDTFDFSFDGVPTLFYGPNGSGKSSLLNAVVWVLTGTVVTDCEVEANTIAIYAPAKEKGRSTKLRDWPIVHTLPSDGDPKAIELDCWAELTLRTEDKASTLYLRRSLGGVLEESSDALTWQPCLALSAHGITPLDLQLSVSAATVFGRRSIEASADTRHLLSMMLGYDSLEDLGSLVTTLATNLTKTAKAEKEAIAKRRERLRAKLSAMPARLRDGLSVREYVSNLIGDDLPSSEAIDQVERLAAARVQEVELELASILGLADDTGSPRPGLADALTSAVATLCRPREELFPTLALLRHPDAPMQHGDNNAETLANYEDLLSDFENHAALRIHARLALWQKESVAGSKTSLLMQVAAFFDQAAHQCPVCEQSIQGMGIESDLMDLKDTPSHLRTNLLEFFRNLTDELNKAIPGRIQSYGEIEPAQRIIDDWTRLRSTLGSPLFTIVDSYEPGVKAITEEIGTVSFAEIDLIPSDADVKFYDMARSFLAQVRKVRKAIAVIHWSEEHLLSTALRLESLLTSTECDEKLSLSALLARGKHAAADVAPVAALRTELAESSEEAKAIGEAEKAAAAMEEMNAALDEIKPLGKYAAEEVERIFDVIKVNTMENFRKLYPYSTQNLTPSRLHLNKGRDKTVEAYLSGQGFEIPGQHVANAGLLRAIALAFYFALLERHPAGLGFIIMDDPILSLDDDHREAWAANILRPTLSTTQVIVATHQRQFIINCGADFNPGRLVELNPRSKNRHITFRPGDRLEWAQELLDSAWSSVPNELRKYREDVLITLDAYSPISFFNPSKLRYSLDCYAAIIHPNPLANANQNTISQRLMDDKVTRVLDPGSHSSTEANVTKPMVEECLRMLRELDQTFRKELIRLEWLRLRDLKSKILGTLPIDPIVDVINFSASLTTDAKKLHSPKPTDRLRVGDEQATWSEPIRLTVIGTAAAKTRGCVVDISESPFQVEYPPGGAVLVAEESLSPVARPGQWVLLAENTDEVEDGDLAAVTDRLGNHYLRRIWSAGDSWLLEAVNPLAGLPPKSIRKADCLARKVIGVSYAPRKPPTFEKAHRIVEWLPRRDFTAKIFDSLMGVLIEGTSLEPVASNGQLVLVNNKITNGFGTLHNGSLAVVETENDSVGNVIKCVFPQQENWLLISPNVIDPHDPISISIKEIRAVWPVCGILFTSTQIE